MSGVLHKIDRFGVVFDDESLVADAGLLAAATLMGRLGLASLVDATVRLGRRPGAAAPGRKVQTLVAAMLVGATHIDHVDRLRAGATGAVLGFKVAAASTVGVFLRSFTWGHVRQLDKAAGEVLKRAWAAGGGPGEAAMTIDVDSTICEVSAKTKAGAAYGHTKQLGYHPLVASRADTGEVLHARLRKGSSQSGNVHFVVEAVGRARRAGAAGELCVRADSGFFSYDLLGRLDRLGVRWSITIPQYGHVKAAIGGMREQDWEPIAYTAGGQAHVAETTLVAGGRGDKRQMRLVVRRSRLIDQQQAELWPDWRYHAFITNRTDLDTTAADAYHRAHATDELAIRDLKESTGLAHLPSGSFAANAAWLACATVAHNLYRWLAHLAKVRHNNKLTVGQTVRNHLLAPGASSTTPDAPSCACPHDGPGRHCSTPPSPTSAPCPNSAEPPPAPPATTRHQPPPGPHAPQHSPNPPNAPPPGSNPPNAPPPEQIKRRQPHPTAANHQQNRRDTPPPVDSGKTAATHPHRWIQAE